MEESVLIGSTLLLISVFGLIEVDKRKPKSSLGVYDYHSLPLLHPDVSQDQILKRDLSVYQGVLSWFGTDETCFIQAERSGNMRIDDRLDEGVAVGFGLLRARRGVLYVGSSRRYACAAQPNSRWLYVTRQDVSFDIDDILTTKGIYTEYGSLGFTYGHSRETLKKRRIGIIKPGNGKQW